MLAISTVTIWNKVNKEKRNIYSVGEFSTLWILSDNEQILSIF